MLVYFTRRGVEQQYCTILTCWKNTLGHYSSHKTLKYNLTMYGHELVGTFPLSTFLFPYTAVIDAELSTTFRRRRIVYRNQMNCCKLLLNPTLFSRSFGWTAHVKIVFFFFSQTHRMKTSFSCDNFLPFLIGKLSADSHTAWTNRLESDRSLSMSLKINLSMLTL